MKYKKLGELTYSKLIKKYFKHEDADNKNVIPELDSNSLEILSNNFGFEVSPNDRIYRYFIIEGNEFMVEFFSNRNPSMFLKKVIDCKFVKFRAGIPVFIGE